MRLKVAVAQIDSRVGDLAHNVRHHLQYAEKARRAGARLVVFPELSLTGYSLKDLAWEMALDPSTNPILTPLLKTSKEISIVAGFVEHGRDHGVYNAALFLEDGKVRHIHRKIYPPTYGMFEEGRYFSPGKDLVAFDSKHGRFGMLICEDLWHLSLPYLLALDGAEAILCLTASPTRLSGAQEDLTLARVNHEQHRTYARLLSVFVVWSNRVGFEDGVSFWGGSTITNPSGEIIAVGKNLEEDLIVGEIDSNDIMRARRFSRHFLDENPEFVVKHLQRIAARGQ